MPRAEKIGETRALFTEKGTVDDRGEGSLLFCPDCGTLLDVPGGDETSVSCEQCGHEEPASCKLQACIPFIAAELKIVYDSVREH